MATIEQIKQEIQDWHGDPEEPLIAAFTIFINVLDRRNAQITLPSGIAKMYGLEEERVVFWVGDVLYCAHKDRDRIEDGHTIIADWQVDDLYEVKPVNVTVVDFQKQDSP